MKRIMLIGLLLTGCSTGALTPENATPENMCPPTCWSNLPASECTPCGTTPPESCGPNCQCRREPVLAGNLQPLGWHPCMTTDL